jgi:hypothetical protein
MGMVEMPRKRYGSLITSTLSSTLAEILAPLASPEPDADPLLPFMLSPEGFSPDMGTHVRIDALPHDFIARKHLDKGWNKQPEPSICPLISQSIADLQAHWKPIERPTWLTASPQLTIDPLWDNNQHHSSAHLLL